MTIKSNMWMHIILTQMRVPVDRFGMHELFYYPLLLYSYRNGWQIRKCVLCMTIKIKPIQMISHELNYMPCCFPSLSRLFSLILLLYSICQPCQHFMAIVVCVCVLLFVVCLCCFLALKRFDFKIIHLFTTVTILVTKFPQKRV